MGIHTFEKSWMIVRGIGPFHTYLSMHASLNFIYNHREQITSNLPLLVQNQDFKLHRYGKSVKACHKLMESSSCSKTKSQKLGDLSLRLLRHSYCPKNFGQSWLTVFLSLTFWIEKALLRWRLPISLLLCWVLSSKVKLAAGWRLADMDGCLIKLGKNLSHFIQNTSLFHTKCKMLCSLGDEGWKTLRMGNWFSSIFDNSRKNTSYWPGLSVTCAPRLCDSYNHAHAPCPHMWPSPRSGPDSKCFKTVAVGCSCQESIPCQSETATDEIQENKNNRECSNIKARVSVHWRAQYHAKMAEGRQRTPAPCWQAAAIEPILSDSLLLALSYDFISLCSNNWYMTRCISQPWTNFFACRIIIVGLLKLIIKARHDIPEFLTTTFKRYILSNWK